ncbi:MAG: TraR/DksA family transcriptional regulator [Verrucomicrobia bacterium]|nr:MAG: TraR/DksA family transcriptional regulator [Verrucomicrobiota bacterium]
MLTTDQLIELEIIARDELARLQTESEAAKGEAGAVAPDNAIGRLSRLDSMQMQEMALEAQRRRDARIRRLREALERMDAGSFGVCARCHQSIDYERLTVYPEAAVCGACSR